MLIVPNAAPLILSDNPLVTYHIMLKWLLSKFQVFGVGMPNVYRLRAFIGAKIPVDGSFSPYINMYNPYSESIQVWPTLSKKETAYLSTVFFILINVNTV